jgi:hypothetical protein
MTARRDSDDAVDNAARRVGIDRGGEGDLSQSGDHQALVPVVTEPLNVILNYATASQEDGARSLIIQRPRPDTEEGTGRRVYQRIEITYEEAAGLLLTLELPAKHLAELRRLKGFST